MNIASPPPEFEIPLDRLEAQRQVLIAKAASGNERHVRVARRRLAFVGAAVLLIVLLVTPALGIGSSLFHRAQAHRPPSPSEAQKQTGVAPTVHLRTNYDGIQYAVITYRDANGRPCVAEQVGSSGESGLGFGCDQVQELFATGSPVALLGPGAMQEPNRPGFDPTMWDRMWFDGVAQPAVSRLEVVMTDCTTQQVPLDRNSFDGYGVFLYVVSRGNLHAGTWPYKLVAYDAAGNTLSSQAISGRSVPATPAASQAHTRVPQARLTCR